MLERYKQIHFIGIGGAGMSALAYVLVKRGFRVTGSDLQEGHMAAELTEAGAQLYRGHAVSHIQGADAVVVSTAIHADNPELLAAREQGLPILHRSDILKALLNGAGIRGVTVAGAHGKTTTSAMISVIATEAGADPTVVIGGDVASLHGNARNGKSEWVVAEADESDGSFLKFTSYISVITNIEDDHLDHYGTTENIYQAFKQHVENMKPGGTAVLCMDSAPIRRLAKETDRKFIAYGLTEDCDYYAKDVRHTIEGTDYTVYGEGKELGRVHLIVPGRHNVLNSLGAFAASRLMGIAPEAIIEALKTFSGARRRFETKGKEKGIWIVDDYAHHPTEIGATLNAAKASGVARVVCVFQPHRYSRTKLLHEEFCHCFTDCDALILMPVYSAGENPIPGVNSEELAEAIHRATGQAVCCMGSFRQAEDYLRQDAKAGDLIITMGAGDVYKIGEELVQELRG